VGAPQSGQRRRMVELGRGPQRIARESSSGWVVNQGDQEKVVRHRRNWAAHGPQGKIESAVKHGPNSGIEETRRTMNSQRTANSGLTGCLSSGVHRKGPPGRLPLGGREPGGCANHSCYTGADLLQEDKVASK